ncbi:chaperone protein dnaJ-related protein [Prunus dulcis]|uniref:Chaperone protein dnaJ-related protein n=1 Tax=Prunus dulcis TaxID=3755 RepID=A0A4Y1QU68_PRUDU|nr:chaperone protein dnaJ-related protein [Prunus dulcis]
MATMMTFAPWKLSSLRILPPLPSTTRRLVKPAHCVPIQQQRQEPELFPRVM